MTTIQRKFLQTAWAEWLVGATRTSQVDTLESTVLLAGKTYPITFVVLVDSLHASATNRTLLDGIVSHIWHECRRNELPVSQRLQNAMMRANQFVRSAFPQQGASVLLLAFTALSKREVGLDLVHIGNCCAYLLTVDQTPGGAGRAYQLRNKLIELNQADTWGANNVKRGFLKADEKTKYAQQWNIPLAYIGGTDTLTEAKGLLPKGWEPFLNAGFKLKAHDQILCVTSAVTIEQIKTALATDKILSAQALANAIVGKNRVAQTSDALALVIRRKAYTQIDWALVVRNGLLTLFWAVRWLVLLALVAVLSYMAWSSRAALLQRSVNTLPPNWQSTIFARLPSPAQETVFPVLTRNVQWAIVTEVPAFATQMVPTPTATASLPTSTPPPPTATLHLTATPLPTLTNTPTKKPSPTVTATQPVVIALTPPIIPTATPVPTATRTPLPTRTATMTTTAVATLTTEATPTPELLNMIDSVTDLQLEDFGNGNVKFSWASTMQLAANQGFVVVIARRTDADLSDPNQAFGLHLPIQGKSIILNINDLAERSPDLLSTDVSYFWGVRLESKPEDSPVYRPLPNQFWKGSEKLMIVRKPQSDQFGSGN